MCEFLYGSCPFKFQCAVKDKPMLSILRPEDWKKAQFLEKVAQIVAETKNGKISTLLIVQNIYMKPLLKREVPSSYHVCKLFVKMQQIFML
jgi:hypothetical protein